TVGRLLGDLNVGNVTTNILIQPTYITMRVELVRALAPFPEAREAVARVLHKLEHKAAVSIAAEDRTLAGALTKEASTNVACRRRCPTRCASGGCMLPAGVRSPAASCLLGEGAGCANAAQAPSRCPAAS